MLVMTVELHSPLAVMASLGSFFKSLEWSEKTAEFDFSLGVRGGVDGLAFVQVVLKNKASKPLDFIFFIVNQ